jgi:GDP-4-dehydro-6-deoxy-D-mannose reductase
VTTALVTGGHGFVGSYLRTELLSRGWQVISLGRQERQAEEGERYLRAELTDLAAAAAAIDSTRPDVVFHLAASPAFKDGGAVGSMVTDAVQGTFNLCSALRDYSRDHGAESRLVLAGSSAQYGDLPRAENPVHEDSRCNPVTAYGFAKLAAESTARAFGVAGELEVICVRAFNHVGPGEPPTTVASAFASRIASVLDGTTDQLRATDLDAVRDFTDVRDIARGYADAAEKGSPGRVYNLCSGRATTVGAVLDGLLATAGLDRSVVRPEPGTPQPPRPGTISYQVGSAERARTEFGWEATLGLNESLRDLFTRVRQDTAR